MNREILIRAILWQYALVGAGIVVTLLGFGANAAISCACGGLCVAVPNSMLALRLIVRQVAKVPGNPVGLLVGEFVKLGATCALFFVTAKYYPGLNWPAMIFGIIVAALSGLSLLWEKH